MSAYSTRTITRSEAEALLIRSLLRTVEKTLTESVKGLTRHKLERELDRYTEEVLTNYIVTE